MRVAPVLPASRSLRSLKALASSGSGGRPAGVSPGSATHHPPQTPGRPSLTFNNPTITTDDRSELHIDVSANGWYTTLGLTAADSDGGEIAIQLTLAEAYLLGTLFTHAAERHDSLNPRPGYYD